ncbi:DUF2157 domain-containing protein [Lacinutrix sp. WUR7]|uniref:DUF2157 domain-containing protein n=1 Tax=Lacinutrix sp. WUR7 TaxID=2653681 RepID=UPI00193CE49E|nr:DUF2157 domain-containing protein [Lacinutrix sp. WUR7]QRM89414.1 DUF2157 domain-containing protein [Lacinutrix sp. WUR7]
MHSKFIKELPDLIKNEVISKEVALKIESYYRSKEEITPNKLFVVFGVFGSLLVGLGIILILAHNWDQFSRAIKTVFAFLPLVIGQLFVGYSILKKKSQTWKEASGTFLFFAVGASIALVSQIYHLPGDLSSFLLTWMLLCLPVIYLLKSHVLAILHIVFATYFACESGYGYPSSESSPWLYILMIALVLPHYYMLLKQNPKANITSIFNWFIPLSATIVLGAFVETNYSIGFLLYMILFGLLYNIGKIPFFYAQQLRRNGYLIIGSIGTIVILLWTSFTWIWEDLIREVVFFSNEFYIAIALFLGALVVIGYSYYKQWIKEFHLFQYVFIFFSILFFFGFSSETIPTILVNVLLFVLGLITIKIGADRFHFGVLNYGLFIITSLVVCRFFDTNMSFVVRGLLFVTVGFGFFITNYWMLKKQKQILKK